MIILIAESKTMLSSEHRVSADELAGRLPLGEKGADAIMESLRNVPIDDLAQMTGLSIKMAGKLRQQIYDFPHKDTGNQAIEAFTGVVFKSLDYASLTPESKTRCKNNVRIISSLYRWLRPDDIIKNYRFDFTTRLEEGPSEGKALNMYWRPEATKALVRMVKSDNDRDILLLLPGDAAKCIDWKLTKNFARVWKVDFQEIGEGDKMRTPSANRLKTMRGLLLRQILTEGIDNVKDLFHIVSPHYLCDGTPVYPDHLHFIC